MDAEITNQFNLNYEETTYCCSQINGVIPTIDLENKWESVNVNILAGAEFEPMPATLPEKLKALTFWQTIELYAKIRQYWDVEGFKIDDPLDRLIEIGLIPSNYPVKKKIKQTDV